MVLRGITPDLTLLNTYMDCVFKAGKTERGGALFEEIKAKGARSYSMLIHGLIKAGFGKKGGSIDEALRVFEEMKKDAKPNISAYNVLIEMLCRRGKLEAAFEIQDAMKEAGKTERGRALFEEIKAKGFVPDARSYSILIHGLIKACFARETYQLFYAMKEQGIDLDTLAYNTVIDGFCKSGKVNRAYHLLEEMKVKGYPPTVVTYGSVIDRLDEAYMLFEEAKSKGVEVNVVVVYSSLVGGFGKVDRIDKAYLIMEELMQKGLTTNIYMWNCLLDALVNAQEITEALVCFNSMKKLYQCTPNAITYNILINGLCKVRKFNKAFVFWQEMQKHGLL